MILRFLADPDYPDPSLYEDPARCPLRIGESYEVAEIYEARGHVMVRKPGERSWPVPGSPWFCWHDDEFETPERPIPILRCGFHLNDYLSSCFGIVVTEPKDVCTLRALDELDWPDEGEPFATWRRRAASTLEDVVARALYDVIESCAIHMGFMDRVFFSEPQLPPEFAYLGSDCVEMIRMDYSKTRVQREIDRFLAALNIPTQQARVLGHDMSFWQGTAKDQLIDEPASQPHPTESQDQ